MLLAIESFVRMFERLIQSPVRRPAPILNADNDNDDAGEEDRRWAAYRRY